MRKISAKRLKRIKDIRQLNEKINGVYKKKYEEFDKHSLDKLYEIFNNRSNGKRIGGTHKRALLDVVNKKLQEHALSNNQIINDLPIPDDNNIQATTDTGDNIIQQEQQIDAIQGTVDINSEESQAAES